MKPHVFKGHSTLGCERRAGHPGSPCFLPATDPIHTVPAEEPVCPTPSCACVCHREACPRCACDGGRAEEPEARTAADDLGAEAKAFGDAVRFACSGISSRPYMLNMAMQIHAERIQALVTESGQRLHSGNNLYKRWQRSDSEIEQILAQALGWFPWYKDDQENFPGATEKDGVCTGAETAHSVADMAAAEIIKLRAENESLLERVALGEEINQTLRRERDEARAGWRMLWTCCMSPTWGSHKADCPKEPRS